MIVLYTIYSNIQQYALIDVQLNEKNPGYWQNTQKPRRHQKNPDLVEKTQLWQHCAWRPCPSPRAGARLVFTCSASHKNSARNKRPLADKFEYTLRVVIDRGRNRFILLSILSYNVVCRWHRNGSFVYIVDACIQALRNANAAILYRSMNATGAVPADQPVSGGEATDRFKSFRRKMADCPS